MDAVGDKVLANALSQLRYGGAAAVCGLAGGAGLGGATVAPFILRGVSMTGVDSVFYPPGRPREALYARFAEKLVSSGKLDMISPGSGDSVLGLEEVPEAADKMLKGKIQGRYVVDVRKK